ncbi:hypothetical protein LBWT_39370 [Leptolyngbya boryana IAM M-101]|nr:hypothetical protein LBWT_39370 [Leptolyngbya boryana IAM M-101]BAS64320.1 hypothetical protein LBDG_39370 [Leptolyngbya boryana dg5]
MDAQETFWGAFVLKDVSAINVEYHCEPVLNLALEFLLETMLRFSGERNGRKFIGIGLSKLNVERLKDDQPIIQSLDMLGLYDTDIFILYGETEDSIARELETQLGQLPGKRIEQRTKEQRTRGFGRDEKK